MGGGKRLGDWFTAFGFLVHGELVGPDGLIFVNASFNVPAREVAAVGAGEGAGAKSADGSALPIAVVDDSIFGELGFAASGIVEGLADAAMPGGFWNGVAGEKKYVCEKNQASAAQPSRYFH